MCIDASPLQLTGGNPAGGVYSGTGVSNGIFDPAAAGAGTFVITYTYTAPNNCIGVATTTVTVNPLPVLAFASMGPYCINIAPITLTQATPPGGAYVGTGVSNGVFNPAAAGVGTHVITYVYTDGNLCSSSIIQSVTVNPMPVASVNPIPAVCIDAPAFALNFGTPTGGTFAGTGVSNNTFDPAVAGAGVTAVVYFYSDNNQCADTAFQTITVNPLPIVTLAAFPDVCIDLPTFTLTGGDPVGGTYYIDGTQATLFNPSTAGTGVHQVLYVYSDGNSCTDSATGTLTVNPLPVVTSVPMPDVCIDLASFALTFGSPVGGVYSGTGVTGGNFNPTTAGAGTFTLTYTYTDPVTGCVDDVTEDIVVNPLPVVTLSPIQTVCSYSPSFQLSGGSPAGGVFSGPGVTGTTFDPATAGLGVHTITYTYTDPATGCVDFATQTVTVNSALTMAVNPSLVSVCPGFSATIVASGALNYSWTPSAGLSSTTSASVTATPQFTTTYTVYGTDAVGCTGSATGTVNVYAPVSVSLIAEPNEGCKPLTVYFSYNNNSNDSSIVWQFDDPFTTLDTSSQISPVYTYLGVGSFNPSLTVTTYDGCVGTATTDVHAYRIPVADFNAHPELVDFSDPVIDFIDMSLSAVTWRWNFGDPLSLNKDSSNIQYPIHTYVGEGFHTVQLIVTSGHNCADTTTRIVEVLPEIFVYVPNSVSPNGDGINDTWKPIITNADPNAYVLYLYNRWGEQVWETHDLNQAWDGGHKGDKIKEDVYVWILWYKDARGEQHKLVGHVSVLH
jgi:gliding motility-associated-like protein